MVEAQRFMLFAELQIDPLRHLVHDPENSPPGASQALGRRRLKKGAERITLQPSPLVKPEVDHVDSQRESRNKAEG